MHAGPAGKALRRWDRQAVLPEHWAILLQWVARVSRVGRVRRRIAGCPTAATGRTAAAASAAYRATTSTYAATGSSAATTSSASAPAAATRSRARARVWLRKLARIVFAAAHHTNQRNY